ncbi:MAG: PolC-type DNA polymerase III N-terminal domain-containing protein, partial [Firmicutes bacterium]|nr:PolC-type DNA polymerase III N-terminal domain-containing protein [Bacillota bacterium]
MPKDFFEVFPTLEVSDNLRGLFSQAAVTRVTVTSSRDKMRIYLQSTRLLYWQSLREAEREIRRQIFHNAPVDVQIIVKFVLSRQYTPRTLMEEYRESILEELRDYNIFLYNILRQAECTFTSDDEMTLAIEENVVSEGKLEELLQILEKIFCERCGMHFKVQVEMRTPVESKAHKNSEIRIRQEVDEILKKAALHSRKEDLEEKPAEPKKEAARAEQKKTDTKKSEKQEKVPAAPAKRQAGENAGFKRGEGFRSVRRSDNPDVLYGRDFEGESLAIEQIQSEMGEVTIRGQVQSLETRDIRNNKTILMMEITDFTDTIVVKLFAQTEQVPEIVKEIRTGVFLKIRGVTTIDRFDGQLSIGSIFGIKKIPDFRKVRVDTWPEKRVELHCHTKMSDMDGVSDVKDIIKRAKAWGHKA